MFDNNKEFRFARGKEIISYIRRFGATEKVLFGILIVFFIISGLVLARQAVNLFMVDIPTHGGELREGVIGLPRTVNPIVAVTDVDKDMSTLVYSGLMKYRNGNLVPDLAESYSISDDGLTYKFRLKSNTKFQDGYNLTTDDIEFTIQKIQNPNLKSPKLADWSGVTINKISSTEISFVLKKPYHSFLANTTIGIIPKHIWNIVSDEQFIFSPYNLEPIGSGPYKVDSIARDSGGIPTVYTLVTWNKYYDRIPFIDKISFLFFSDEEKALLALNNGDIDALPAVSASNAKVLAADNAQSYTVISTPLPRIFGIFFNQNQAPVLADKNIRQALSISIDRKQLLDNVLGSYGKEAYSPLPPSMASAKSNGNMTDAVKILEKNGWKKNTNGIYEKKQGKNATTTLSFDIYTTDSQELKSAAESIKKTWQELGVDVNIKVFEQSDLYQNIIRTRKYDALLFGEQMNKDQDIYAFWHSSERNAPGLNISMYTNSKADKIIEEIQSSKDQDDVKSKYLELEKVITDDYPAVFLYYPEFIYVIPKALHGIQLQSINTLKDRFNGIESWYLETERVWKFINKISNKNE